jgi:heme-degrading monooxygenase HmoA
MYARHVAVRLKPNTLSDFTKTFETNVLPILRRQKGFQDEITFSMPGETDVVAISLWDTKENAEAYNTAAYPEVLKNLERFLDGSPKLRVSDVISSTLHKAAVVAA